jgi:hypothetical protein
MKNALMVIALLTAAVASPALAQHRVQHQEGIYAGVPAGTDAIQYHQELAQNQGS